MPNLVIDGYRIGFYSYDKSEPMHMHVYRENMEAKFWLEPDVRLARNHGFSERELRKIIRKLEDNFSRLRNLWEAHR